MGYPRPRTPPGPEDGVQPQQVPLDIDVEPRLLPRLPAYAIAQSLVGVDPACGGPESSWGIGRLVHQSQGVLVADKNGHIVEATVTADAFDEIHLPLVELLPERGLSGPAVQSLGFVQTTRGDLHPGSSFQTWRSRALAEARRRCRRRRGRVRTR